MDARYKQVKDIDVSNILNGNSGCKMSVPSKNKVSFIMKIYRVSTEHIPCMN